MKCIRCGSEMTPTIGGNYYCSKCDICLNDAVYRTTTTHVLNESQKEFNFREEFERNLAKETLYEEWQKKDQRIKELEKENEKLKRNLQYAYDDFNEMQQELDNLESDHNLLIKDKEKMFTDMQKEIKFQSDARERLAQKLALYKKALKLACENVAKHEKRVDEEMGIIEFFGETFDYDVNEFVEHYLQQAKYKKLKNF